MVRGRSLVASWVGSEWGVECDEGVCGGGVGEERKEE